MQIDRLNLSQTWIRRPQQAAPLAPEEPVDRVHLGSRPVWKSAPMAGPLPGPLGPAVLEVLRELHKQGVSFQETRKPWFRPERTVELRPEETLRRLRRGRPLMHAGSPAGMAELGQLDQLYTGHGLALPKSDLAEGLRGLHGAGFEFSTDLLSAYRLLEKGGTPVTVTSADGRWKNFELHQDAVMALNALEGSKNRSLVREPALLTAAEQLQGKFHFYLRDSYYASAPRPELAAYLGLRQHRLHLQSSPTSPPVPVDPRSVQDPHRRVEEGTRLALQFTPHASLREQAEFLRSVYQLSSERRGISPELAAGCLAAARSRNESWDHLEYRLSRLPQAGIPLSPEVAAGYACLPERPEPLHNLQIPVGTPEERRALFVKLAAEGKLENYLDHLPQDDRVAAYRFFLHGRGSLARPALAAGLQELSGYTFQPADPDTGRVYFESRERELERPGIYLAAPTGRVMVCAGWNQPTFPVPGAWLETPERVKQRAQEAAALAAGPLQCEDRKLAPQLMAAAFAQPDPIAAAPHVKRLGELEGEKTLAIFNQLGQDLERVIAWSSLRSGRSLEETQNLLRLADQGVGRSTLTERATLLAGQAPEAYIREVCARFSQQPEADSKRLTSVWLLGESAATSHALKQEGEVLQVGAVRLPVRTRPSRASEA